MNRITREEEGGSGAASGRTMEPPPEVQETSMTVVPEGEGVAARPALARVLVVEDSRQTGGRIAAALARAGFAVRSSADGLLGLHAFIGALPDLIVASDRIEGLEVFELVRRVREISDLPVVVVARADAPALRARAKRLGVDRWIVEACVGEDLVAAVLALSPQTRSAKPPPRLTAARVRHVARSALRSELERLLVECRGNLAEVGRRMGKDRSTIRYHLRRFDMLVEESAMR